MHKHYNIAFKAFSALYKKLIVVDLTKDIYNVIEFGVSETYFDFLDEKGCYSSTIKELIDIAVCGTDKEMVMYNLSLPYLRSYFKDNRTFYFRYRQIVKGQARWQVAELARAEDYRDDHQKIYCFLKDIHDTYSEEVKLYEEMERICRHDSLTGLNNFYSYRKLCMEFKKYHKRHSIGVIFCDLNGLKLVNDTKGHTAGNLFITDFTALLSEFFATEISYRISGDEFLVIMFDIRNKDFNGLVDKLQQRVFVKGVPVAAIGAAWNMEPESIEQVTEMAEVAMYADKASYYREHPEMQRHVFEDNLGREMLAIISSLTAIYPTVGVIDLESDSFRMLKADNSSKTAAEGRSYTEYIDILMSKIVTPETYDEANRLAGIEKLRTALKDNEKATVVFESRMGGWRQLTCQRLEMKHDKVTKVIFYINYVDRK